MNYDDKWERNVCEAGFAVVDSLLVWIGDLGEANPEYTRQSLEELRNQLYAFFVACGTLSKWFVSSFAVWRERLDRFHTCQQYCDLFAAIQASSYLLMHGEKENLVTLEIWGTQAMYSQEDGFSEEWLNCLEWLNPTSNKRFDVAVSHKRYDKIAQLCGLEFNMADSLAWDCLGLEIVKAATAFPQLQEWQDKTDAVFSEARSRLTLLGMNSSVSYRTGKGSLEDLEAKKYIRAAGRKMREHEMMQAQDLIVNCQSKYQFAKTYMVYGSDVVNTVREIKAAAEAGDERWKRFLDFFGIPPHLHTRRMLNAVLRRWTRVVDEKRQVVAGHFRAKWGEPITNYARDDAE